MDRQGIAALLGTQRDFEVVGEARTVAEAASRCKRLKPDVAIISVRLPDQEGITAVAALRVSCPNLRMIAMSERGAEQCLVLNPPHRPGGRTLPFPGTSQALCTDCLQIAVSEGALGALRRDAEPEELFQAVRAVAQGNAWFEAGTAAAISRGTGEAGANGTRALSARELEVASHISQGLSNKEIGRALGISEPTVKKHVGHILAKLHLQDRLQVGIYIVRNPLLLEDKNHRE